ncbi:GGDEF domain-containing protein [Variovorax sp. HJSM1_2]|uniref:GGDEF domain-containing protein n=1 Tax=Variovorax sp. HJSM1_2 TaxID=3366263 RepID=UPI003BBB28BD
MQATTSLPTGQAAPTGVPRPFNEAQRLSTLREYQILDTGDEAAFNDLASIAAAVCNTPVALVSLVDADRQWFKARIGVDVAQTPRDASFCARAILRPDELMEIPDAAKDSRFSQNPLVTDGLKIRFYAGAPLLADDGTAMGTLCVIDQQARELTPTQCEAMQALSRQVMAYMNLRKLASQLAHQSSTDALTGIWNRRAFDLRLQEEWSKHLRRLAPLALLMLDVDLFKSFNDSFGHPAGDVALTSTARILSQPLRTEDFCARYGGEEFAMILPELDMNAALLAAERLRLAVEKAPWPKRPITVSIGVSALVPRADANPSTLVARADRALYDAKASGRNQTAQFKDWSHALA